ncbi:uncharacterized protein [Antennarius striatus]|uniref:uncharacterized protein n=1 Tax=Antennarius striatus TaxID=241820 RepID=UPI0035ADBA9F
MKRRCVPLRADHTLLTPDTHSLSGVRLHPTAQPRSGVVPSLSGHLGFLPSSDSAPTSTRRRPRAASPTRRLRFEDETETEVESRYLERQRRWAGQRGACVLVSKPDLSLYVNGKVGQQGGSCGTVLGSRVNLNLQSCPFIPEDWARSLYRSHLHLRTEPIRETYIGSVTPAETSDDGPNAQSFANLHLRTTSLVELNANQGHLLQATPTDLPINPYAPDQLTTPTTSWCPSSSMMSQDIRFSSTKEVKNQNQNLEEPEGPAGVKPQGGVRSVEGSDLELRMKNSSSFSSSSTSEATAENHAPPLSDSSINGQIKQPMKAEIQSDVTPVPEQFIRDDSIRLSLRRLFSSVRLGRTRTGSLDRLSSRPLPSAPPQPAPSPPKKSTGVLRKTLSVQSLSVGSPIVQLRKLSSVQNLLSEKKRDRSADYRPAADQVLHRCLSLEDVGCPSSVRHVGRVLEVCSDGTFLLEISRPNNRKFGFIISRGRRRADSGVYVEDMADGGTQKLYAGLLAVGDEILEVNQEKVAHLSLDQVTRLLTQNTSATVRVLRHHKAPPQ